MVGADPTQSHLRNRPDDGSLVFLENFPNAPNDGKCVWRALARHFNERPHESAEALENAVAYHFRRFTDIMREETGLPIPAGGLSYEDFRIPLRMTYILERFFHTNIIWYTPRGRLLRTIHPRYYNVNDPAHFVLRGNHCEYIADFNGWYACSKANAYQPSSEIDPEIHYLLVGGNPIVTAETTENSEL